MEWFQTTYLRLATRDRKMLHSSRGTRRGGGSVSPSPGSLNAESSTSGIYPVHPLSMLNLLLLLFDSSSSFALQSHFWTFSLMSLRSRRLLSIFNRIYTYSLYSTTTYILAWTSRSNRSQPGIHWPRLRKICIRSQQQSEDIPHQSALPQIPRMTVMSPLAPVVVGQDPLWPRALHSYLLYGRRIWRGSRTTIKLLAWLS